MELQDSSPDISSLESDPLNLTGNASLARNGVGNQVMINFQPVDAETPEGYIADSGQAYSEERGRGWVLQNSLDESEPTPLNISSKARERNAIDSQRLDTLVHMQPAGNSAAAWEYDLPNGTYHVIVGVGDRSYFDSRHVVNVEGTQAIAFVPTPQNPLESDSVQVDVTDGKLTVDAEGGDNTKLLYLKIAPLSTEPAGNPEIVIRNLDGSPYRDRLVFSRIGSLTNPPPNGVHDVATLQIDNVGSAPLEISDLSITGPWEVADDVTLPTTIAAGNQLDLPVRFIATSGDIANGTLTLESNDADEPNTVVQLSGFWQSRSEGGQEPSVREIFQVLGYTPQIVGSRQRLNQQGLVQAIGAEVLSPYWQRANSSAPVTVHQLAAYHTYPAIARLRWHAKGSETLNGIFVQEDQDAQSLLPRKNNSEVLAQGTFRPSSTFGFRIDGEWSDPTKNNQQVDINNGSPGPAGHHVRFWPARDRQGERIDDAYLMIMDYAGINYDYNDNVYLIRNIEPETRETLYRIDVGSNASYTDTEGRVWSPDTGLFQPASTAVAETAPGSPAIVNTNDDVLYQTYRGRITGSPPQDRRVLTFNLPIDTPSEVDVRLHFAETNWGVSGRPGAGQRIFDVRAEGETVMNNFDIFAEATGAVNATVVQIRDVEVDDGVLDLAFDPEKDFAAIAAIEVIRPIS